MVIAAAANSAIDRLEDVQAGATVAMADNRDVKLIGLRLLEAVDIEASDLNWDVTETYQAAARKVIKDEAQVAFFLAEIFHSFSRLTKTQLSVLIESGIWLILVTCSLSKKIFLMRKYSQRPSSICITMMMVKKHWLSLVCLRGLNR